MAKTFMKGRVLTFLPTPNGKMLVKLRLIYDSNKNRTFEVTSSSEDIITKADDLCGRALVLRRADYEYLSYTRAGVCGSTGRENTQADQADLLFASEDLEKSVESYEVEYARHYYPHLFKSPGESSRHDIDGDDGEDWHMPLSQDY